MNRNILLIIFIYSIHLKTEDFIICSEPKYNNRDYWTACQQLKTLSLLYDEIKLKFLIDIYKHSFTTKSSLQNHLFKHIYNLILLFNPNLKSLFSIIKPSIDFIVKNEDQFLKYIYESDSYGKWGLIE